MEKGAGTAPKQGSRFKYIYIYARTHNENIHIHTVGLTAIINRIA